MTTAKYTLFGVEITAYVLPDGSRGISAQDVAAICAKLDAPNEELIAFGRWLKSLPVPETVE